MKLYKIEQNVIRQAPYGACDSAIVAAEGPEQARLLHPTDEDATWDGERWCRPGDEPTLAEWAAPHQVSVTELGEAAPGVTGVVCASVWPCSVTSRSARVMHEIRDEAQQAAAERVRAHLPQGLEAWVTHADGLGGWWLEVSRDLSPPRVSGHAQVEAHVRAFVLDRADDDEWASTVQACGRCIERSVAHLTRSAADLA